MLSVNALPIWDGRTPLFVEWGADPRVSPGFDLPIASLLRFGVLYFEKLGPLATDWGLITLGAMAEGDYWLAQIEAASARFLGPTANKWAWFNDNLRAPGDDYEQASSVNGTYTTLQALDLSRGGVHRSSTTAVAGSSVFVREKSLTSILGGRQSERWAMASRARFTSAPFADCQGQFSLQTSANGIQVQIGVDGNVSTTQWMLRRNGGSTSGGAIDQNWHTFLVVNDVDASLMRLFVDDVQVASITNANLQNVETRWAFFSQNRTTASDYLIDVDKVAVVGLDVTV